MSRVFFCLLVVARALVAVGLQSQLQGNVQLQGTVYAQMGVVARNDNPGGKNSPWRPVCTSGGANIDDWTAYLLCTSYASTPTDTSPNDAYRRYGPLGNFFRYYWQNNNNPIGSGNPVEASNVSCVYSNDTTQQWAQVLCTWRDPPAPTDSCGWTNDLYLDCDAAPPHALWRYQLVPTSPGNPNRGLLLVSPRPGAPFGPVCKNNFRHQEALAACRALGLLDANRVMSISNTAGAAPVAIISTATVNSLVSQGTMVDHFYLSECNCGGFEVGLDNCGFFEYSSGNTSRYTGTCNLGMEVGVDCHTYDPPQASAWSYEWDVAPWTTRFIGRVRVRPSTTAPWGEFCLAIPWDTAMWQVQCRYAGFGSAAPIIQSPTASSPLGPTYMTEVASCSGTETHFANCFYIYHPNGDDCLQSVSAPVNCIPVWKYKLVGSETTSSYRGLVYVQPQYTPPWSSVWGYVCQNDPVVANEQAKQLCKVMGFFNDPATAVARFVAPPDLTLPIYMVNLSCPSYVSGATLLPEQHCYFDFQPDLPASAETSKCTKVLALDCNPSDTSQWTYFWNYASVGWGDPKNVRGIMPFIRGWIAAKPSAAPGANWGTVSGYINGGATYAARAACRSLGFADADLVANPNIFARGTNLNIGSVPILLSQINCATTPNAHALNNCTSVTISHIDPYRTAYSNLDHGSDAFVDCYPSWEYALSPEDEGDVFDGVNIGGTAITRPFGMLNPPRGPVGYPWGGVCVPGWDWVASYVFCNSVSQGGSGPLAAVSTVTYPINLTVVLNTTACATDPVSGNTTCSTTYFTANRTRNARENITAGYLGAPSCDQKAPPAVIDQCTTVSGGVVPPLCDGQQLVRLSCHPTAQWPGQLTSPIPFLLSSPFQPNQSTIANYYAYPQVRVTWSLPWYTVCPLDNNATLRDLSAADLCVRAGFPDSFNAQWLRAPDVSHVPQPVGTHFWANVQCDASQFGASNPCRFYNPMKNPCDGMDVLRCYPNELNWIFRFHDPKLNQSATSATPFSLTTTPLPRPVCYDAVTSKPLNAYLICNYQRPANFRRPLRPKLPVGRSPWQAAGPFNGGRYPYVALTVQQFNSSFVRFADILQIALIFNLVSGCGTLLNLDCYEPTSTPSMTRSPSKTTSRSRTHRTPSRSRTGTHSHSPSRSSSRSPSISRPTSSRSHSPSRSRSRSVTPSRTLSVSRTHPTLSISESITQPLTDTVSLVLTLTTSPSRSASTSYTTSWSLTETVTASASATLSISIQPISLYLDKHVIQQVDLTHPLHAPEFRTINVTLLGDNYDLVTADLYPAGRHQFFFERLEMLTNVTWKYGFGGNYHSMWSVNTILTVDKATIQLRFPIQSTYYTPVDERIRIRLSGFAAIVKRNEMVESFFTIAAPIRLPWDRVVWDDSEAVLSVSVIGVGAASAAAAARAGLLITLEDCRFYIPQPLAAATYPIGVPLSSENVRYYLGAAVFNPAMIAAAFALHFALGHALSYRRWQGGVSGVALVGFPSLSFMFMMYFIQNSFMAAVFVVYRGDSVTVRVTGAILCFFWLLLCVLVSMPLRRYFSATFRYERGAGAREEWDHACKLLSESVVARKRRWVRTFFYGADEWTDGGLKKGFVRRFSALFAAFRESREWYVGVEMGTSLLLGLIGGLMPDDGDCEVVLSLTFVVLAVHTICLAAFRPYVTLYDGSVAVLRSCLQSGAALFALLGMFDVLLTLATVGPALLLIQMWVDTVKALLDVALTLYDFQCRGDSESTQYLTPTAAATRSAKERGTGGDTTRAFPVSSVLDFVDESVADRAPLLFVNRDFGIDISAPARPTTTTTVAPFAAVDAWEGAVDTARSSKTGELSGDVDRPGAVASTCVVIHNPLLSEQLVGGYGGERSSAALARGLPAHSRPMLVPLSDTDSDDGASLSGDATGDRSSAAVVTFEGAATTNPPPPWPRAAPLPPSTAGAVASPVIVHNVGGDLATPTAMGPAAPVAALALPATPVASMDRTAAWMDDVTRAAAAGRVASGSMGQPDERADLPPPVSLASFAAGTTRRKKAGVRPSRQVTSGRLLLDDEL